MISMEMKKRGKVFAKGQRNLIVNRNVVAAMHRATLITERNVKENTPISHGTLVRSIASDVSTSGVSVVGKVGTPLEYAEVVEKGRKPGKFPNIENLELWVQRTFQVSGTELRRLTFRIARSIKKKGIRGRKMFEIGLNESRPKINKIFKRVGAKIASELNDDGGV